MGEPHLSEEINSQIIRLTDLLWEHERATGIQSLFLLIDESGYEYCARSGKPAPFNPLQVIETLKTILEVNNQLVAEEMRNHQGNA